MKFPYVCHEVDPSANHPDGLLWRPEVPLKILGVAREISVLALADSGADLTLIPRSLAGILGISLDEKVFAQVGGVVGNSFSAPLATVQLELSDRAESVRWSSLVGFMDFGDENAAAVLGHAGRLVNFTAVLDGELRQLELQANARIPTFDR